MSDLRDFLYLDTAKTHSFVSQISGGLTSQINEIIKKHGGLSAGVEIGIPSLGGGKVEAGKQTETERQQTMQLTDPAYFKALYAYLESESTIKKIDTSSLTKRNGLEVGQFVEIKGIAEPPAVEYWITKVRTLMDFFEKNIKFFGQIQTKGKGQKNNSFSRQQIDFLKGMLNFLEDFIRLSRKDPSKQFVCIKTEEELFSAWCGVIPIYTTTPLDVILPAEVTVVGRIERVLAEGESFKIVDFSKFNQSNADIGKLFDALNALSPMIGQGEIKEKDLQADYPDVFITPIAIYR